MQTKIIQRMLTAMSLTALSSIGTAATIPYGVFDKVKHNDYSDIISAISNQEVFQIAKTETVSDSGIQLKEKRKERRSFRINSFKERSFSFKDHRFNLKENNKHSTETLLSLNGLTITGTLSNKKDEDDHKYTAGTWNYSGTESIDWLVIKYGQHFGLYQVTGGDTSGTWDIAELEKFSREDASGAKFRKYGKVHYSSFSHATAYSEITPVPVPAAGWLLVSGLLGLVAIGRRKTC